MHEHLWRIDDALGLVDALDTANLEPAGIPEQTVDTVLLRNLETIPKALFGASGRFIFHSALYWGEFDVCASLSDRRLVAFENKGGRLTKRDVQKFRRDVQRILVGGYDHVQMRFKHVLNDLPGYTKCAERMFAAAFLGVRCDVVKDSRDLPDEVCSMLAVTKETFHERFHRRNDWLAKLDSQPDFDGYLTEFTGAARWAEFVPILLVPAADIRIVEKWIQGMGCPLGIVAQLATFRVGVDCNRIPNVFSIQTVGSFAV